MPWRCRLFSERLNQVKVKLEEVLAGQAREYRDPLAALQHSMQARTQVAGTGLVSCLARQTSLSGTCEGKMWPLLCCHLLHLRCVSAGVHRELCLQVIHHKRECELQGAKQHLEVPLAHARAAPRAVGLNVL